MLAGSDIIFTIEMRLDSNGSMNILNTKLMYETFYLTIYYIYSFDMLL